MTPHLLAPAAPLPAPTSDAARCTFLWKPAGLPVFAPHGEPDGPSLLSWWQAQPGFPPDPFPPGFEGGIAHRLDTATSGLVLVARTPEALVHLRAQFSRSELRKFYVFRSRSGPSAPVTVETPLGHHPKNTRKMVVADRPYRRCRGKWYPAWSRFTWLRADPDVPDCGLWQAEIRTGVMHQIRAHALSAGIPLVGDPLYGQPGAVGDYLLHHARVVFGDGSGSPEAPLPTGEG